MGVFGDLIRNVLHQSGLPLMFWVFAAQYVANVYNMTVIPYKKSKTPYAMRYPRRRLPQNIAHFGQLVTYVPKNIEKHTARSRQGIFLGYSQLPGGVVTDEYKVIPLSCFTQGLKNINIITSRDVRFPAQPVFQIKQWNDISEGRKYIEKFKPLDGESYFKHIWENLNTHAIYQDPSAINVYEDGNIVEHDENEEQQEEDEDDGEPEPLNTPGPEPAAQPGPSSGSNESPGTPQEPPLVVRPEVREALRKAEADRIKRLRDAEFFKKKKLGTYVPVKSNVASSSASSSSKGPPSTTQAAPIAIPADHEDLSKVLIEFACDENSLIGQRGPKKGVRVIRLTEHVTDLLTKRGLQYTINTVRANPGCSLHASIPCSPWSQWVNMNLHRLGPKFRKKLERKRAASLVMLHHFTIAC